MAVAFVFFSYQFGTYGTNGIRNGMACALMMLSISFYIDRNKYGFVVGTIIFLLAMGCHRSVMIPMAALLVSMFIIKDIKYSIYIWLGCIFLSLVSGNFYSGIWDLMIECQIIQKYPIRLCLNFLILVFDGIFCYIVRCLFGWLGLYEAEGSSIKLLPFWQIPTS